MSENPIFSYTKRDYEGSRQEGISQIPALSEGQWTDLNATNPGIIILDYVHAIADMLSYYQDHQALETFLSTAKERASVFRIARQMKYHIKSASGARCNVIFATSSDYTLDAPIKIPQYTKVETAESIKYVTEYDAYLPKGESRISVTCIQGVMHEKLYTGTGISRYSSNLMDAKDQEITLNSINIDESTISIIDNLNREWIPVENIAFAREDERVYEVLLNPDNSITIKFGNGKRGYVPTNSDILKIKYVVTDAEEGRIGAETISILNDDILDNDGHYLDFTVSNIQSSNGGTSAQSTSSIKELAPGVSKSQGRAVTLLDFENLAKNITGVKRAKAYSTSNAPKDADLSNYEIELLITPDDTIGDEALLLSQVHKYLYQRMIPPMILLVRTPAEYIINLTVNVKKLDTGVDGEIKYAIYEAIRNYFDDISTALYISDLSAKLSNIIGVRYISGISANNPDEKDSLGSAIEISELSNIKLGSVIINVS